MRAETKDTDHATRRKLLEVASTIFAESGFRKATVRNICARAGTNIAAIHYHFGSKQALYQEALHYSYRKVKDEYPPDLNVAVDSTADQRLYAFIHSWLLRVFRDPGLTNTTRLMMREMIEPTPALRMIVETELFPLRMHLEGILRQITNDTLDEDQMRRAVLAVSGQVIVHYHILPALQLLWPDVGMDEDELQRTAQHITRFSLAALRNIAAQPSVTPPAPAVAASEPGA